MNRDLNDTLIFVNVVESGSFTSAARTLGLPKTTVSRKLRELENRLGARLLNRTTRRLALTEAGTVYFEHCKRISGQLEEAESAVHQLEGSPRGWLRITAPYTLAETVLTPMLVEFRQAYPEVHLDIVLSNDVLDLLENKIDVALRVGPLADSTFVARRLAVYTHQVYASEGYLERYGEPVVPEDLQHHRALVNPNQRRGQRYCWQLHDGEREEEFEVKPVLVANDPFVGLAMLGADQGLMLANEVMVKSCMKFTNVRRVLAAWTGTDMELHALFQRGPVLSPKVRAFVDFMAEKMEMQCIFARMGGQCVEHQEIAAISA
jgi:LysR family transcriptional regulator for bpeEF and oprC